MNRYMVEPFCGLSLWFVAYDEKDLAEMKEKTIENSMFFDFNMNYIFYCKYHDL